MVSARAARPPVAVVLLGMVTAPPPELLVLVLLLLLVRSQRQPRLTMPLGHWHWTTGLIARQQQSPPPPPPSHPWRSLMFVLPPLLLLSMPLGVAVRVAEAHSRLYGRR